MSAVLLLSSAAIAAPEIEKTTVAVGPRGEERAIAVTGPVTVENRDAPGLGARVRIVFDEPLIAYRRVEVTGALLRGVEFAEGDAELTVVLVEPGDASHVVVRVVDALSKSGIADAEAWVRVLVGDLDGDGFRTAGDARLFAEAYGARTGAADLNGDGQVDLKDGAVLRDALARRDSEVPDAPPRVEIIGETEAQTMTPIRVEPGSASRPIKIRVRDDRVPSDRLLVSVESSNPSAVPAESVVLSGQGDVRTASFAGAAGGAGESQVFLRFSDEREAGEVCFVGSVEPDSAPNAVALSDTIMGVAPLAVRFDATGSNDSHDNISLHLWSLGNGVFNASPAFTHVYDQPGTYEVELLVMDANGNSDTATRVITVAPGVYDHTVPVTESEARRFLWQAAFGPSANEVQSVMFHGYEEWIELQATRPVLYLSEPLREAAANFGRPTRHSAIWENICVEGPDQLRQRVAWALIQIIAISTGSGQSDGNELYNLYMKHALPDATQGTRGNYRDLLLDVTFNRDMGSWLTYYDNRKANPATGTQPDENYAREIMQLFTCGLLHRNIDGTPMTNVYGERVQAYDPQEDVAQLARIFTGFVNGPDQTMVMRDDRHEFGAKQLLIYPGVTPVGGRISARPASEQTDENARIDVETAVDLLFNHPSTAPFISRQLIQRLVTSNPTPAYVERVARAFEGAGPYGSGERGDLLATVKAILLDDEARNPAYRDNPFYGKPIEPIVLHLGALRVFNVINDRSAPFPFRVDLGYAPSYAERAGQAWLQTPTVFNFYQPDHAPLNTPIAEGGFYAPELQIVNENTAIEFPGLIDDVARVERWDQAMYDELIALSPTPALLVDRVDMMVTGGRTSPEIRAIIEDAVAQDSNDEDRLQLAVVLILISPETRVLK